MLTPSLFTSQRLLQRLVLITTLALCSLIGAIGQKVWRTKCVTPPRHSSRPNRSSGWQRALRWRQHALDVPILHWASAKFAVTGENTLRRPLSLPHTLSGSDLLWISPALKCFQDVGRGYLSSLMRDSHPLPTNCDLFEAPDQPIILVFSFLSCQKETVKGLTVKEDVCSEAHAPLTWFDRKVLI